MSGNYAEETKPLFKLLRTEAFRFVIVRYNHYSFVQELEADIRRLFPNRPIKKVDALTSNYQDISSAYFSLQKGFFFVENFDILLKEERDSLNRETSEMKKENERRRHITAGLNLRRDKMAQFPIVLFVFVPATSGELYARTIMEKMPDLWSLRSFILDLEKEMQLNKNTVTNSPIKLGGNFQQGENVINVDPKQDAELNRLLALLEKTPESEVAYRLTLYPQIIDIAIEIGNYEQALLNLEQWENQAFSNDKPEIWLNKSDIFDKIGNFKESKIYIEKALKRFEKNKDKLNISISFERLGVIYENLGDYNKALSFYKNYNILVKELNSVEPDNDSYKHALAYSYGKLGNIFMELGDLNKSQNLYNQRLKLSQELYITHPENISYKENLAICYGEIGDINVILNDSAKALSFFAACNKLFGEICSTNSINVNYKGNFANSYSKLGGIYLKIGDLRLAAVNYSQSKKLCSSLVENSPTNIFFQSNYAESICVNAALDKLLLLKMNTEALIKARYTFNKLYNQTQNPKFKKKAEIVDKMLLPDSDLKQLILDISMF
jgi:tetratricopeptide (TPR) repeat protein